MMTYTYMLLPNIVAKSMLLLLLTISNVSIYLLTEMDEDETSRDYNDYATPGCQPARSNSRKRVSCLKQH